MSKTNFDVVVVGAGFAGLSAAMEARRAGASVLIIEKMKAAGGNSAISDGGMAVPGSPLQKRAGIEDSPDLMFHDMMEAGLGINHPGLVRTLVDNALDAFTWATDYLGVDFLERIDLFGGHSVPRNHAAVGITGNTILKPMLRKAEELGIELWTATMLRGIVLENGNVCGIDVERDYDFRCGGKVGDRGGSKGDADGLPTGTVDRIAAGAVVLASGGFGADIAFRTLQDPRLTKEIDTTNKSVATAEALVEALRLGAAPVHLSHIQLGPWGSPDEKGFGSGPLFADYIAFIHGIIVRPDTGMRFVDERSDRKTISDAILTIGKPCVCIADGRAVKRSGWDLSKALKKRVVRTFDSVDSLAEAYDIPAPDLQRTIGESKVDAAGTPLYAMRVWPKVHFTMGGVGIDESARVLDLDGGPIPGLFAAGEVTGGVHGASRLGSCAITECLVFGRIAGRSAAAAAEESGEVS